jgi:hypothetical protein
MNRIKRNILNYLREWMRNFGVPWSQYTTRVEIFCIKNSDDICTAEVVMKHKHTRATIHVSSIYISGRGEVLQFDNPDMSLR